MGDEARIEINGTPTTEGQSMAVRVACTSFLQELTADPDALGGDEHGRRMAAAYRDRLQEVLEIIGRATDKGSR